jgi:hypothetical protein
MFIFLLKTQLGEYQSGQLGQTVNLLSYDFIGSNPISPTKVSNFIFQIKDSFDYHCAPISKSGYAFLLRNEDEVLILGVI